MPGTVEGAEAWIARLEQAIRARQYDCDCQVGGVDAMSIDTDWLRQAVADIKVGWASLRQAEAELARYKAFADEVLAHPAALASMHDIRNLAAKHGIDHA